MSNTLSTMTILQQRVHASANLCLLCGVVLEKIQHIYQVTHEGSSIIWTESVDTLNKWLDKLNKDPDIMNNFSGAHL